MKNKYMKYVKYAIAIYYVSRAIISGVKDKQSTSNIKSNMYKCHKRRTVKTNFKKKNRYNISNI